MKFKTGLAIIIILSINGCFFNSPTYYENQGKKNLTINSDVTESVSLYLQVFEVDKECKTHSKGLVFVQESHSQIALKPKTLYYLKITFSTNDVDGYYLIHNSTLLRTHDKGHHIIKASYIDSDYDVKLFTKSIDKGTTRELNLIPLKYCSSINK